jgi:hypothetical protein
MVSFMRKWLVPMLAALLFIGIAITFIPFSRQMETRAETELTLLMDRAFARVAASEKLADPMIAAQEESLLSKAHAVSRFLTHDDALLQSDALAAMCAQLFIDRIDVANLEGTLIASSDAAMIGTALGTQEAFAWTMTAADDASAALAQQDETDPAKLYACVGRSDIEGFVLLTRADTHVQNALMLSDADSVTADLPYGGDVLFVANKSGTDGFFYESGNLCLRRTQGEVTMIAARPTTEVFAVRNAAILAFCACIACIMICGIAAYLLRLEPVSSEAEDEQAAALDAAREQSLPEAEETPEEAPRRKRTRPRRTEEEVQSEQTDEAAQQHEKAMEHAPRQITRGKKHAQDLQDDSEEGFEKILE